MRPEGTDRPEGSAEPRTVHIHYRRPPDRVDVFHQRLLLDTPGVKVTLASGVDLPEPVRVGASVVLEPGSDAVWFTFPGLWHDIGLFHLADGTHTGLYANVLTPPTFHPGDVWRTTDLFLDLWLPPGGAPEVLDRDQLEEAVAAGWVEADVAERARREAEALVEGERHGAWPPSVVGEWSLERARRAAGAAGRSPPEE